MKKTKIILGVLLLTILLIPNIVSASEKTDAIISKISKDGKTFNLKSVKPTTPAEGEFLMSGIIGKYLYDEEYFIYGLCEEPDYTTCNIVFQSHDLETRWDDELQENIIVKGDMASYTLTATYDEPSSSMVNIIDKYVAKLRNATMDVNTWYEIEDLSLINYYMTSNKSELWNNEAPGRALKYVKELNEITEGTDLNFYLDVRLGSQDETLMYESAFGPMTVFYGDYAYTYKEEGLYLKRVIYIPEETADNKEAYIEAAQKRIDDYLGKNSGVKITYGGLLSSLEQGSEDEEKPITSDGNYYNVKILDRTYKFYIVKGSNDKLVKPTYSGKNIETNISISSNDSSVPLDTKVSAEKLTSGSEYDRIIKLLNVSDNLTYDLNLYSESSEKYIKKLSNGTFEVKIPIPEEYKGKDLIVYYVDENNKIIPYDVKPDGGYATFNTDHFSIYTLALKDTNNDIVANENKPVNNVTENPKTNDNILIYLGIGIISLIGIGGITQQKRTY